VASAGPHTRPLAAEQQGPSRKGRATAEAGGDHSCDRVGGCADHLYGNYERLIKAWAKQARHPTVFIVVCNNNKCLKACLRLGGGLESTCQTCQCIVRESLRFSTTLTTTTWSARPVTLLIDSVQLETGGGLDDNFKKAAAPKSTAIGRVPPPFSRSRRRGLTGRGTCCARCMNTVGKPGRTSEQIRCVIRLYATEGWDANTVTHILGVRAFGTQLLCEQVVGRGLRRASYTPNEEGRSTPNTPKCTGALQLHPDPWQDRSEAAEAGPSVQALATGLHSRSRSQGRRVSLGDAG